MSTSGRRALPFRRRWLLFVGGIVLVLAVISIGGYQLVTTADTLHLIVSDSHTLLDKTTHDTAKVQRLYAHTLALRSAATGTYSCPVGPALTYHLIFSHLGITTLDASVSTANCQFIVVFWSRRQTDNTFWNLLSQAVNEPLPFPPGS